MPFADDIADHFPEVERADQTIELSLRDADARAVRELSRRLGMRPVAVVRFGGDRVGASQRARKDWINGRKIHD